MKLLLVILRGIFVILIAIAAIHETGIGLLQAFGLRMPGHAHFVMTGSFDNPGPYGGLVAAMMSLLVAYIVIDKKTYSEEVGPSAPLRGFLLLCRAVALLSVSLCIIVLPASMSRAAWLSAGVALLLLAFRECGLRIWIRNHRLAASLFTVVLVLMIAGAFLLKKDSAIGRFHIWHMELRAICQNPLHGTGEGTVLGTYGKVQAEYFAQKQRSETLTRVAGCPEYAFNEYLKVGVEHGIPAMACVVFVIGAVIAYAIRRRMPVGYGFASLAVFAFFSYPLSALRTESDAEKQWRSLRHLSSVELYEDAVQEYGILYDAERDGGLKGNYRFLYDYGYALHKTGKYEESNRALQEGARLSSDPMFHNIMGRNHEAMQQYEEAEREYLTAHHMVPSRLYPLILLMEMHVALGDFQSATRYANLALQLPVNQRLTTMRDLHDRALHCLDTLAFYR